MKKLILLLMMLALISSTAFAQIALDGDDTDWAGEPVALEAVDNVDGFFPSEVGAIVSNIVDVKEVKAKIVGNVFYFMIRFQEGPAWPNKAKQSEYEGVPINRSRGYYHLLLDQDNDVTTGWDSHYYEAHYTPVGYLASQGVTPSDKIGADTYLMWGTKYYYTPPHPDSGGIKNSGVNYIEYAAYDVSEIDAQTDAGADYDIFGAEIPRPDSAKGFAWNGTLANAGSDDPMLNSDPRAYWVGHAWGHDFLEMGIELTMIKQYWMNKGMPAFNSGDVIGIAAMIETPMDDWGVDLTPRGEVTCPMVPERPHSMAFDGDSTDWAAAPVALEAVDNVDGFFPSEVGAIVSDVVDVKTVKAFVNTEEDAVYWFIRFHGGPAWPNKAKQSEYEGTPINRSRGYYHLLLDVDNDVTTGWDSHYYEAHYTPVGYLASQGVTPSANIGADIYLMWGTKYYYTPPHPDSGGIKNTGVNYIEYAAYDVSEIDAQTDAGADYTIYGTEITDPDSGHGFMHDGMMPNMGSDDASLLDDHIHWNAHAWGYDFLEMGQSLTSIKKYWMNKFGVEVFQPGDMIGIAAMIETPMDDWGVDLTPRGEMVVGEMRKRPAAIVFDREDADWEGHPVQVEAVDNVDGFFPSEVGAIVTDIVDVKEVKAFTQHDEDMIYWMVRFHGGPAWPNKAKQSEYEGTPINRSRGYYHLLLDLDNDVTTGWDSHYYEAHYTPVGYLASQGVTPSDKIGADTYLMWGTKYYYTAPHPDSGGIKNSGVNYIEYAAYDVSEIDAQTDAGADYTIYGTEIPNPDSAKGFSFLGLLPVMDSDDSTMVDNQLYWNGHSWGYDFIEVGMPISLIQKYWKNKGMDVLMPGDVVGIAAMIETPMDDWGVDLTPRGEFVVEATGVADKSNAGVVKKFALENNYPNPFNPMTTINYTIPQNMNVSLVIYNVLGQKVRTLVDAMRTSGNHSVKWDGKNDAGLSVSTGVYIYRLTAGSNIITKKMSLLK